MLGSGFYGNTFAFGRYQGFLNKLRAVLGNASAGAWATAIVPAAKFTGIGITNTWFFAGCGEFSLSAEESGLSSTDRAWSSAWGASINDASLTNCWGTVVSFLRDTQVALKNA